LVAVAAALVATLVNHKSNGESKQRKAVAAYIQSLNLTQSQMGIQLIKVRTAYGDLTAGGGRRRHAPAELAAAVVTVTRLERQLVATPAPPEARKLRSLLVKLVAEEAGLTREVQLLAAFTPRFAGYLARLRNAGTRFDMALRAIPQPKLRAMRGTRAQVAAAERRFRAHERAAAAAQANAIDMYLGSLTRLLKGLGTLHAPPVVAPALAAEMRSLHDSIVTGGQLSAALRAPKGADVANRIRAFTLAGREAANVASQRAQIAAILAYNRRSRAVGTTASAVQTEVRRLGGELP
jgi:hypothetical protein